MISNGPEERSKPRAGVLDSLRMILVVIGYGTLLVCVPAIGLIRLLPSMAVPAALGFIVGMVAIFLVAFVARRDQLRLLFGAKLVPLADVLVLGVLVAWGLICNSAGRSESPDGKPPFIYLALAEPEVLGLVGLHAISVTGYAVARRRPGALHHLAEPIVHGCLIAGILLHALIAVQLRGLLLWGFLPPLLPLLTPLLTIVFYAEELVSRLRRRGAEAAVAPPIRPHDSAFRGAPSQQPLPPAARIHRRLLAWALVACLVIVAGWALVQKTFLGWAPFQAFTHTYGHTFSKLQRPDDSDRRDGLFGAY